MRILNKLAQTLSVSLAVFILAAGASLPQNTAVAGSNNNETLIAPNLMIIFGNAWSMNRKMDDQTYPSLDLDGAGEKTWKDFVYRVENDERYHLSNLYANQPSSKFYQSKEAFLSVLNDDDASDEINLGLATFRQTFGLPNYSTKYKLRGTWPLVYPPGGKPADTASKRGDPANPAAAHPDFPDGNPIYTASTPEKEIFSQDPKNFSYTRWNRQGQYWYKSGGSNSPACDYTSRNYVPRYGKSPLAFDPNDTDNAQRKYFETGRGFVDDAFSTFLNQNDGDGGLPLQLRYSAGAIDQQYSPTECNNGNGSWPWATQTWTGARSQDEANSGDPVIEHKLCRVSYNSQTNHFQALYVGNRPFFNNYGNSSQAPTSPGNALFDSAGRYIYRDNKDRASSAYDTWCSAIDQYLPYSTDRFVTGRRLQAVGPLAPPYDGPLQADSDGLYPSYMSLTSHFYEGEWSKAAGAKRGALTGWSGETTYDYNSGDESMTAVYPSGVADPCRDDRNLCPNEADITKHNNVDNPYTPPPLDDVDFRYAKEMGADKPNNPRHMGAFLDLPDPDAGYTDQRDTLRGFMGLQQMDASGLEYNPENQTIDRNHGLTTSSHPWHGYQSPIYQSLFSALAYFTAYKEEDPYDNCGRSNNILLFYDGKEDGRWSTEDGVKVYAKPEEMATKLYEELGVNIHVVILSNNPGDIDQANLIAQGGGTKEALVVNSLDTLKIALSSVFAVVRANASRAAPAIGGISHGGDNIFEVQDQYTPNWGQVVAHTLGSDGEVSDKPIWQFDDGTHMTVSKRQQRLHSTDTEGKIVNFYSDLDDEAFNADANPSVATIREYTMDPSYGDDSPYLGNRKKDSLLGLMGDTSPVLVNAPGDAALFHDSEYRKYMSKHIKRAPALLFTSQDGFLYTVDATQCASGGELKWGWMPRQFVDDLKGFTSFPRNEHFKGHFRIVDAKNASGVYGSYLIGSAEEGRLHYTMKLANNEVSKTCKDKEENEHEYKHELGYEKLLWEDYAEVNKSSPNNAAPLIWRDKDSGRTYVIYITGKDEDNKLTIRDITNGGEIAAAGLEFDLEKKVSATPLVVKEKDNHVYIYIGTDEGRLHRLNWTDDDTSIHGKLAWDNNFTGNEQLGEKKPITYIGYARYQDAEYLRVQSLTRLTVLKRLPPPEDTQEIQLWKKRWSTFTGGATTYSPTEKDSLAIQHLADNAEIDSEALIVRGSILLPAYEVDAGENVCSIGGGYFYFFRLDNGLFPSNKFIVDKTVLTDSDYDKDEKDQDGENNPKVLVGSGRIHDPRFTIFSGLMTVYGHTENSSYKPIKLLRPVLGARTWREIRQD
ncbi:MAG: hypothetical protein DSZ28_04630 [Thiothrix sp.]|nr:MAG: hypothetical protein DSZ28_04630 [Thiothrix sp.]